MQTWFVKVTMVHKLLPKNRKRGFASFAEDLTSICSSWDILKSRLTYRNGCNNPHKCILSRARVPGFEARMWRLADPGRYWSSSLSDADTPRYKIYLKKILNNFEGSGFSSRYFQFEAQFYFYFESLTLLF